MSATTPNLDLSSYISSDGNFTIPGNLITRGDIEIRKDGHKNIIHSTGGSLVFAAWKDDKWDWEQQIKFDKIGDLQLFSNGKSVKLACSSQENNILAIRGANNEEGGIKAGPGWKKIHGNKIVTYDDEYMKYIGRADRLLVIYTGQEHIIINTPGVYSNANFSNIDLADGIEQVASYVKYRIKIEGNNNWSDWISGTKDVDTDCNNSSVLCATKSNIPGLNKLLQYDVLREIEVRYK